MQQNKKTQPKTNTNSSNRTQSNRSPKRIGLSIKKESILASDYLKYNLPFACEDCTHFKSSNSSCTLGFPTENHLRKNQADSYLLSGKMALCRFQEID